MINTASIQMRSNLLVAIVTAGTADIPVAEEAAQTLEFLCQRVARVYDVGVAGLHRLLDQKDILMNADVIISVAGMEGALTSVVAGLVACSCNWCPNKCWLRKQFWWPGSVAQPC